METLAIIALVFIVGVVGVMLGIHIGTQDTERRWSEAVAKGEGAHQRELEECREQLMRSGISSPEDDARHAGCV